MDIGTAGVQIATSQKAVDDAIEALAKTYNIELPALSPGRTIPQSARGDVQLIAGYVRNAQREERMAIVIEALAQRIAELESKLATVSTKGVKSK